MFIILEHSGTPEHCKTAEFIQQYAEDEYGLTVQPIVGDDSGPINIYKEDLEKIAEFNKAPDETELSYYFNYLED